MTRHRRKIKWTDLVFFHGSRTYRRSMYKLGLNKNIDNIFMTTVSTKVFMFTFAFSDSKDIRFIFLARYISRVFSLREISLLISPTAVWLKQRTECNKSGQLNQCRAPNSGDDGITPSLVANMTPEQSVGQKVLLRWCMEVFPHPFVFTSFSLQIIYLTIIALIVKTFNVAAFLLSTPPSLPFP